MLKWLLRPLLKWSAEYYIQLLSDKAPTKTLTAREIIRTEAMKLEYK